MKISAKGEYYGSMKKEENYGSIFLSEYDYCMPATDWHYHENPYFMYVLEGNVGDFNTQQKRQCPSGTLLFHNWQEAHYNTKESIETRGFHIEFERKWFVDKKLNIDLWEGTQIIENPKIHHLLAKLYAEFKFQDHLSEVSIEVLLYEICEHLDGSHSLKNEKVPLWIAPLKELIKEEDERLSLQYLSDQLGVHPGHISRAIPKYFSVTLGNYIRQQKIKKAINLIHNPKQSLQDITYECGFSDQSHFTRTFKLFLGMTPKQYRNRIK
ncbi:MAG: AraC family transcriptional regulator [Saprospiraceae bacterium]|nr:AraC family transcriptional regulator [Saprospiraceae bacterium]